MTEKPGGGMRGTREGQNTRKKKRDVGERVMRDGLEKRGGQETDTKRERERFCVFQILSGCGSVWVFCRHTACTNMCSRSKPGSHWIGPSGSQRHKKELGLSAVRLESDESLHYNMQNRQEECSCGLHAQKDQRL